jgi:undecaprenyl-diphosphatase
MDTILKDVVRRPRPHLFPGAEHAAGYSFPSGHAMDSIAFFAVLVYMIWHLTCHRDVTVAALAVVGVLTALVGLARVVLGVHYPSDVVGGYLGGIAWVALTIGLLGRALEQEQTNRPAQLVPRRHDSGSAA